LVFQKHFLISYYHDDRIGTPDHKVMSLDSESGVATENYDLVLSDKDSSFLNKKPDWNDLFCDPARWDWNYSFPILTINPSEPPKLSIWIGFQVYNLPILVYCFEITGMITLIYLQKRTI